MGGGHESSDGTHAELAPEPSTSISRKSFHRAATRPPLPFLPDARPCPSTPARPQAPKRGSPEFHYLPRFVRDYEAHHPDQVVSAKGGTSRTSPSKAGAKTPLVLMRRASPLGQKASGRGLSGDVLRTWAR